MSVAVITISPLCENDITSKTIRAFLQIAFSAGTYVTGGLAAGVAAYMDAHTVDVTQFLQATINGEMAEANNYGLKYIPSTDTIQIFSGGTELANGASLPSALTGDTLVGEFVYNRL